ncbi:MAG: hypothetical protein AB7O56_14855 [Bauldia sp.]
MAFTIKSTENYHHDRKHRCIPIETVDRNKLLVRLDPPLPASAYRNVLGEPIVKDMDRLVLAPRYVGDALTPVPRELPIVVNMCRPKPEGTWTAGPWCILDIGLLEEGEPDPSVVG